MLNKCVLSFLFVLIAQSCGQFQGPSSGDSSGGIQEQPSEKSGDIRETIRYLAQLPKEDIASFVELKRYRVYYSITTSPERLPKLHYVLDTLDLSVAEKVFIVLPKKYRNKEEYDANEIERIQKYADNIEILRPEDDLGPSMKLTPAVKMAKSYLGESSLKIVVTFDDDTGYPAGLPMQLIKHSIINHAAVGGSGQNATFWGMKPLKKHKRNWALCGNAELSSCDVLEGFHGVAYPVDLVDVGLIEKISAKYMECRFADDLVVSFALAEHAVDRFLIKNKYTENLKQFDYGFGPKAQGNRVLNFTPALY